MKESRREGEGKKEEDDDGDGDVGDDKKKAEEEKAQAWMLSWAQLYLCLTHIHKSWLKLIW